nr:unnamed protein product [Callosobruchus analis]
MIATALERHVDILVVAEPNKIKIENSSWLADTRRDAAIYICNRQIKLYNSGKGSGFVWVDIGGIVLYSCYFSPNSEISEFEVSLHFLKESILEKNAQIMVCGDFNAKAPEWGMSYTDKRGEILTDWIAGLDLVIANNGNEPTFIRDSSRSVIDITLTTDRLSTTVCDWRVLDIESLSCHRYIQFKIGESSNNTSFYNRTRGWNLKRLDTTKFKSKLALKVQKSDIISAETLIETLTQVCDSSMPKRYSSKRKSVYWWSEEIADTRKACIKAKRASAKRNLQQEVRELRKQEYKDLRRCFAND